MWCQCFTSDPVLCLCLASPLPLLSSSPDTSRVSPGKREPSTTSPKVKQPSAIGIFCETSLRCVYKYYIYMYILDIIWWLCIILKIEVFTNLDFPQIEIVLLLFTTFWEFSPSLAMSLSFVSLGRDPPKKLLEMATVYVRKCLIFRGSMGGP